MVRNANAHKCTQSALLLHVYTESAVTLHFQTDEKPFKFVFISLNQLLKKSLNFNYISASTTHNEKITFNNMLK